MTKIPDWATATHNDIEKDVEVRLNPDGTIDEIVIGFESASFHLEQMDDGQFWIGVAWKETDGTDRMQHIMLTQHGKNIYPTVYT
jgi:hypothetical protein